MSNYKPLLELNTSIAELCKPLFNELDLTILNFIRVNPDGQASYLCDNRAWLEHYFKSGYHQIGAFEHNTNFRHFHRVTWSSLSDNDPVFIDSRNIFNIRYGITLVRQQGKHFDYFNFGTHSNEPSVREKLLKHTDTLNQFANYFYDAGRKLILRANKHALMLTGEINKTKTATPNRVYLGPRFDYQYLTKRELDYLRLITTGKTNQQIAEQLNISNRTAEKHLENIKNKLGCDNQYQLGYIIAKLQLDEHFLD